MADRFEVKGLRELGLAMKELNADIAQKIAFAATLAAANVVKKAAKDKAPIADEAYIARGREAEKAGRGRRRSGEAHCGRGGIGARELRARGGGEAV